MSKINMSKNKQKIIHKYNDIMRLWIGEPSILVEQKFHNNQ